MTRARGDRARAGVRGGARPGERPAVFFDRFRGALARLPAGLIRVSAPATDEELEAARAALGRELPELYASFLRTFDGVDLFHETVRVAGVGKTAALLLADLAAAPNRPEELVFAVGADGDRYALDSEGRVLRSDAGAEERSLAGSSFARWLDGIVAREQVLYGSDGEYAPDVFDEGGEVTPIVALRQAERALRADPGSADAEHARGLALARLGRGGDAAAALARATELDSGNPWIWFDLGRAELERGAAPEAVTAFRRAADLEPGPGGARLLAWAARAAASGGDASAAGDLRLEALFRDGDLPVALRRAVEAAANEGDDDAHREATELLAAIAPEATPVPPRLRLPVLRELAAPRPRTAAPPRPRRETPRRDGGSRRGS